MYGNHISKENFMSQKKKKSLAAKSQNPLMEMTMTLADFQSKLLWDCIICIINLIQFNFNSNLLPQVTTKNESNRALKMHKNQIK